MDIIYHLAPAARWDGWPAGEPYFPAEYDADGFVHCTAGEELLLQVANHYYRRSPGDFVVLALETRRLTAPLRWERPGDGMAPSFPHLYGPIERDAVVGVYRARRDAEGAFVGWDV